MEQNSIISHNYMKHIHVPYVFTNNVNLQIAAITISLTSETGMPKNNYENILSINKIGLDIFL